MYTVIMETAKKRLIQKLKTSELKCTEIRKQLVQLMYDNFLKQSKLSQHIILGKLICIECKYDYLNCDISSYIRERTAIQIIFKNDINIIVINLYDRYNEAYDEIDERASATNHYYKEINIDLNYKSIYKFEAFSDEGDATDNNNNDYNDNTDSDSDDDECANFNKLTKNKIPQIFLKDFVGRIHEINNYYYPKLLQHNQFDNFSRDF